MDKKRKKESRLGKPGISSRRFLAQYFPSRKKDKTQKAANTILQTGPGQVATQEKNPFGMGMDFQGDCPARTWPGNPDISILL